MNGKLDYWTQSTYYFEEIKILVMSFQQNVYFSLSFDLYNSEYYWMQDGSGSHMQFPSHGLTSKASFQGLFRVPISSWQPVSWERCWYRRGASLRCFTIFSCNYHQQCGFLFPEIILKKCSVDKGKICVCTIIIQ